MQKAGLKGNVVTIDPTGFERLAFWITALAPLLLLVGIIGAYLEFKIPGRKPARNHRRDLLRSLFPRPLFRWAGGLGSCRSFRPRCLSWS